MFSLCTYVLHIHIRVYVCMHNVCMYVCMFVAILALLNSYVVSEGICTCTYVSPIHVCVCMQIVNLGLIKKKRHNARCEPFYPMLELIC